MFDVLHDGSLYYPMSGEILDVQTRCLEKLYDYNQTRPSEAERRAALLREMFCEIGEGCYIEPPFHANWGGHFVHFGKNVYANFGLTLVDDTHIYVGDNVMFGPNVVVATAGHPILPALREQGLQYNASVHIGKNCWIGAGALVMPGITIGEGSVIGAVSCARSASATGSFISATGPSRRHISRTERVYFCAAVIVNNLYNLCAFA